LEGWFEGETPTTIGAEDLSLAPNLGVMTEEQAQAIAAHYGDVNQQMTKDAVKAAINDGVLKVQGGLITDFDPVSLSTEILFKKHFERTGTEIIDRAGIGHLLSDSTVMTSAYADQIISVYAGLGVAGQLGGLTKDGLRQAIWDGVIVEQGGQVIGTNPEILIMESFNQIESNYGVAIYTGDFSDNGNLQIGIIDSGDLTDDERAAIDSQVNTLFSKFMKVGVETTFESDPADPSKRPRLGVDAEIDRVFRNMQTDLFGTMIPTLIKGKFKTSEGKSVTQPGSELARYQQEEINKIIEQYQPEIMNLVNSALAETGVTNAHLDKIFEYMTKLENSVIGDDSLPGIDDPEALKHFAGLDRAELILGNEEIKNKIMFGVTEQILANDTIPPEQRKQYLEQAVDSYSQLYKEAEGVDRLHAKTMVAKLLVESSKLTDPAIRLSAEKESALLKDPLGFPKGSSLYHEVNNPDGVKLEVFATQAELNAKANEDFAALANRKLTPDQRQQAYEEAQKKNANTWLVLNGSMWGTDQEGRVTEVRAEIIDTPSGRTFTSENGHNEGAIGKWSGSDKDNNPHSETADLGFHLLGDNLLGPVNRLNIVPGYGTGTGSKNAGNYQQDYWNLNTGDYSKLFEFPVDLLSRAGGNVSANIKIKYPEEGVLTTRPESFDVSFTSEFISDTGEVTVIASPKMTFTNGSQGGMTQKQRQEYSKEIIQMLTDTLNDPNADIDTKWIWDAKKTVTYHRTAYYAPQDGSGMLQPSAGTPQQLEQPQTPDRALEEAFASFKMVAATRQNQLMGDAQRFIGDYPPPPGTPLPPAGGVVAEVRQILNTLQNSDNPIVPGDERVQYLADATNSLNNIQGAILSLEEKIQIFDLTHQAGIQLEPEALQRLGLSGSPFQTPSEGFTQDIQDMLDGKSTEITVRLTDPKLANEHPELATLMGDPTALDAQLAGMDETARRAFMQSAAESLAQINSEVFGLDTPPTVVFSSDVDGRGFYNAETNTINLSEAFLNGNATEALMLVDTVSHEASHAWQNQLKTEYQNPMGTLEPGTPEHSLAVLLTANDQMPQAGQDDVQYLQRWDEKAAFAIGDAVITGALSHKNDEFGTTYTTDYRPQYPDGLPDEGRDVPAGYEQSQGAMHLHITETAYNNNNFPTANTVYANGRKVSTSVLRKDGTPEQTNFLQGPPGQQQVASTVYYTDEGEPIFRTEYDLDPNSQNPGSYRSGGVVEGPDGLQWHGVVDHYNADGSVRNREEYENGVLVDAGDNPAPVGPQPQPVVPGSDTDRLFDAIRRGDEAGARAILNEPGVDIDLLTFDPTYDSTFRNTPIHTAMLNGMTDLAVDLVNLIDTTDPTNAAAILGAADVFSSAKNTPLHLSLKMGNDAVTDALMTKLDQLAMTGPEGAAEVQRIINTPDAKGKTPLQWAAIQRDTETMQALIGMRADTSVTTADGRTVADLYANGISYTDLDFVPGTDANTADDSAGIVRTNDPALSDLTWFLQANAGGTLGGLVSPELLNEANNLSVAPDRNNHLVDLARFAYVNDRNAREVDPVLYESLTGQPYDPANYPPGETVLSEADVQERRDRLAQMVSLAREVDVQALAAPPEGANPNVNYGAGEADPEPQAFPVELPEAAEVLDDGYDSDTPEEVATQILNDLSDNPEDAAYVANQLALREQEFGDSAEALMAIAEAIPAQEPPTEAEKTLLNQLQDMATQFFRNVREGLNNFVNAVGYAYNNFKDFVSSFFGRSGASAQENILAPAVVREMSDYHGLEDDSVRSFQSDSSSDPGTTENHLWIGAESDDPDLPTKAAAFIEELPPYFDDYTTTVGNEDEVPTDIVEAWNERTDTEVVVEGEVFIGGGCRASG
jgi:ankyrin repeat protein